MKLGKPSMRQGICLLCLAPALVLRVAAFGGFRLSDPYVYTVCAHQLASGDMPAGAGSWRIGTYGPVAALIRLFGLTPLTLTLYPLACSLITVVLVFYIARRFLDLWGATLCTLLISTLPIEIINATRLCPETPLVCFSGLGFLLACRSMDVKTKHAGLFALLAGIVTGLAFSAKETGLLTAAIIMGWLACSGNGRRMILPFITGVACLVLLECVFFRIVSGDFLYHYRAVSQYQLAKVSSHSIEKAYQSLHIYPREMVRDGQFAMGFLIVLTGLPLLARRGVRIMPVVWLLVGFLTLQFASSSLSDYVPVPHASRYLQFLSIPLCITAAQAWRRFPDRSQYRLNMLLPVALLSFAALAFLVSRYGAGFLDIASDKAFKISVFVMVPVCVVCLAGVLLRRLSLRWLAALPLVFMCVFGAVYAVRFGMLDRRQDNIAHAYSFLGDDPALPVFTDHRTTWGLLMYWAFDPPVQLKTFDETPPEEIPANSYVLVNAKELFFSRLTYGKRFSETLIPENWPDNWVCERICNADIRHGTLWIVRVTDLPQSL